MSRDTDKAVKIIGGGEKSKRAKLDFYPTPAEVTFALMKFLPLPKNFSFWEPACGTGAISDVLKQLGYFVFSSDINDMGASDMTLDFLDPSVNFKCDVVITNPPFNLAEEFIRKSLVTAPVVIMILKSQFWHAKKRMSLFYEHPPAYVIPLCFRPDFTGQGASLMDIAITVWIKGETDTKYKPIYK